MTENAHVNKVVYGGDTLVDLTDSTVTAENLAKGATAYDASGKKIVGTMEATGGATLPEYAQNDAGKVLKVNADGSGVGWDTDMTGGGASGSKYYIDYDEDGTPALYEEE